jgi:predicted NBD/HSP70 family sugar kinase
VREAVAILQNIFNPDVTVLGGGNAKKLDPCPEFCTLVDNRSAYVGARRLWEDADLFASAGVTSWHIHHNEAHK